jgi:hypothetical protein
MTSKHHLNQMINNKEMALASATTDLLRTKGLPAYQEFVLSNSEEIGKLKTNLSEDRTNFNAFGAERREQMLLEYAIGLVCFSSLTEEEKNGIIVVAQRQYAQNNQVMVSWLLGGLVCIGLLIAFVSSFENTKDSNQSQTISPAITEVVI